MKKTIKSLMFIPLLMFSLASCDETSTSTKITVPENPLQEAFYKLIENNYTLDYTDSYANYGGVTRHQKVYYTAYSIQREGDFGFYGIATGDDVVFNYTIEDNQIVSSTPILRSDGMRYRDLYDYRRGFADFDISYLSDEIDEEGYYSYKFGNCLLNDKIVSEALFFRTYTEYMNNASMRIKIIGSTMQIEATLLVYDRENDIKDSISLRIYDVGQTENSLIKQYLDDGKTAKTPLDTRFYRFIAPYLSSYNYTSYIDATNYLDVSSMTYSDFRLNQYFTDNATLYENLSTGEITGEIYTQGVVCKYSLENINDTKLTIIGTPYANSDFEYYSYLYGGAVPYSLADLEFYNFVGYIDETRENTYVLTDSYLVYVLSNICFFESDSTYNVIDECRLEIIDENTHRFKITFESSNKSVGVKTGTCEVEFFDLNETSIPAAEQYISLGNDPTTQTKEGLKAVLGEFNTHNYSMDLMSVSGLAKYYFTDKYMYCEVYGSPANNYGYIKDGDSIYSFTATYNTENTLTGVTINTTNDYATGSNAMTLPGCGSYFGAIDDLSYLSMLSEEIYNIDNYEISSMVGMTYWKNNATGFSQLTLDYIGYSSYYYPLGSGFLYNNSDDDTRLSLLIGCLAKDGSNSGIINFTFYDLGSTTNPALEEFLF